MHAEQSFAGEIPTCMTVSGVAKAGEITHVTPPPRLTLIFMRFAASSRWFVVYSSFVLVGCVLF
jgi:hypothetical protein